MSKSYKPHQVKAVEIKLQKALITEHDLYNYETINLTSKKIITNNDILIGESQNEFILSDPANTFGTPVNPNIEIKKEGDSFYLKNKFTNPRYNQTQNKKYKIVRSAKLIDGFNPKGMPLKLGTIFKLGKSKFRVIEINKYKKNKKELEAKTLKSINEIEKNYNDSQQSSAGLHNSFAKVVISSSRDCLLCLMHISFYLLQQPHDTILSNFIFVNQEESKLPISEIMHLSSFMEKTIADVYKTQGPLRTTIKFKLQTRKSEKIKLLFEKVFPFFSLKR